MGDTNVITRKIKLWIEGDDEEVNRVYSYIRNGMYAQNKAYNILTCDVYSAIRLGKSNEEINEIYKKGSRKPNIKKGENYSLYKYGDIDFPVGLPIPGCLGMMVRKDMKTAKEKGLFKMGVNLQTKKLTAPLRVDKAYYSFYHTYDTYDEFLDHLYNDRDTDVYMKFVNGIIFKVIFGDLDKSNEIRHVFQNIFEEYYHTNASSIEIDGKKIILNLTITIPKTNVELDENTVVGVDVGIKIPAMGGMVETKS